MFNWNNDSGSVSDYQVGSNPGVDFTDGSKSADTVPVHFVILSRTEDKFIIPPFKRSISGGHILDELSIEKYPWVKS